MVSFGRRKHMAANTQPEEHPVTLPMPGVVSHNVQAGQVAFPETSIRSNRDFQNSQQEFLPTIPSTPPLAPEQPAWQTKALMIQDPHGYSLLSPQDVDELEGALTGKLSAISNKNTTSLRTPVVIPGSVRKSHALRPPKPQGKRIGLHIVVSVALVLIVGVALMAVLPAGANGLAGFPAFNTQIHVNNSKNNNFGAIAAVAATATAVTTDGYTPVNNKVYAGVNYVYLDNATGDNFPAGQCTYWADYRYHQLSGHWVNFSGNAYQWYYNSMAAGWIGSSVPTVPSIIVLAPGVQGASYGYGHVAVVERINADGSVLTSNWNWAGNWGRTTDVTFYPGPGVHFITHP